MQVLSKPGTITVSLKTASARVQSIDLLRGLVMIIMALDHVRDYFHADAFLYDPTDLSKTNVFLFFTRWITHFCAPTFMFLSGTSAYLVGVRKGKKYLSRFLFTRGLWLIFLEFAVFSFAWSFNIHYPIFLVGVIWALGVSMIALSTLIYLPFQWIIAAGLIMVLGHNLLDNTHVPGDGMGSFAWSVFHESHFFTYGDHQFMVGYPIIPWIGVMALGYSLGKVYTANYDEIKRKKFLIRLGAGAIALFIALRATNIYGDPSPWSTQSTAVFTFLSFIKVSKYPPSLLYLLMTLGPAMLFLAFTEKTKSWLSAQLRIIGRVPMFYYIIHLYLIHLGAMIATYFSGLVWRNMILTTWVSFEPKLKGYGFSLGIVYAVWFILMLILYFLCRWYDRYKRDHAQQWWLSYL
jgi:uncharacterized membrane protein